MSPSPSKKEGRIKCSYCHYDANPVTAKFCQKCGKSLIGANLQNRNKDGKGKLVPSTYTWLSAPLNWLGLTLLLPMFIFIAGSYILLKTIGSPQVSSKTEVIVSNDTTQSTSSDIKYYNSMKEVSNVPEGKFYYGGAFVFASLNAQGTHQAINQLYPKFQMRYIEPRDNTPGSGAGIAMLLNGELSIALSTRPLEEAEYSKARSRGFTLQQVPIAIDGVGFFVHPDVSIPGLSVNQLQNIYRGKITNWKDVGGSNLAIAPFRTKAGNSFKMLLGSEAENVSPNIRLTRDFTETFRKVSSTPGAIGLGTATLIVAQQTIRPIAIAPGNSKNYVPLVINGARLNTAAFLDGTYPLTRRIFAIVRRDKTPEEMAGVAYANLLLSTEGQQFVEKAGFVPIR
ncbi:substrate-binding domain-containing protein [Scytonema sp. NUACC26]|uniref:substrate-binding domain-containing protein n=1 Tax=Scytonema sp. NUACC26 TaxID=3140176 RepID=UPI0034DCBACF